MSPRLFIGKCRRAAYKAGLYGERERMARKANALLCAFAITYGLR